jgi:hypothetical protein
VNNQGEQIQNHYPSKILGFFSIEGKREAVIQCSVKPLLWSTVDRTFFVKMKLGRDFNISFVTVPIEALVHPLCVIQIAVVTTTSKLLFYQNVIGADSLGKELSSLQIFKYCKCVQENRNIRGHQQFIITSD